MVHVRLSGTVYVDTGVCLGEMRMTIERKWAMPNRWTYTIKPIKELIERETEYLLGSKGMWCDPFGGKNGNKYASVTNDINPDMPTDFHVDALEFLKSRKTEEFDGVLYDPPYSFRQASECYKGFGKTSFVTSKAYWMLCKNEVARIVKKQGKVIGFGWNSNGLGEGRGFTLSYVLLVPHGGSMNDTICTVEMKGK